MNPVLYILMGYLSGSILFAKLSSRLFQKDDFWEESPDQNPGTANAFQYGGFMCGLFTLLGDLLKGFLPVFLYLYALPSVPARISDWSLPLVLAAPVLGHTFPVFYHFRGGKGIAVSFGCLLGLIPYWRPAITLAVLFIFFSTILVVRPHYYRTIATFLCALLAMALLKEPADIWMGFLLITCCVLLRLHMSKEEKDKMKVSLLWKH